MTSIRFGTVDLMVFKSKEGALSSIFVDSVKDTAAALKKLEELGLPRSAIEELTQRPPIGGKILDIPGVTKRFIPQDYYFVQ